MRVSPITLQERNKRDITDITRFYDFPFESVLTRFYRINKFLKATYSLFMTKKSLLRLDISNEVFTIRPRTKRRRIGTSADECVQQAT